MFAPVKNICQKSQHPIVRIKCLYSPSCKGLWEIWCLFITAGKNQGPIIKKETESRYWGTPSSLCHMVIIISFIFEHKISLSVSSTKDAIDLIQASVRK